MTPRQTPAEAPGQAAPRLGHAGAPARHVAPKPPGWAFAEGEGCAQETPCKTPAVPPCRRACGGGAGTSPDDTGPAKFAGLFAEPRHFRADARLVRTALRRGWVGADEAGALIERLSDAMERLDPADFATPGAAGRAQLAAAGALIALLGDALAEAARQSRYPPGQTRGRPRGR